jgi:hypothetical protein
MLDRKLNEPIVKEEKLDENNNYNIAVLKDNKNEEEEDILRKTAMFGNKQLPNPNISFQ